MKKSFKRDKIKNICKVFSGATPSTNNAMFWNGEILWITPNDLSKLTTPYFFDTERKITQEGLNNSSTHLMPRGTLVMSSRAPIGYLAIAENDFTTNQGCKSFSFYENYDSLYFYYCLQNQIAKLKVLGEGTTFAEISKSYIEEFEVSFPENKSEQSTIGDILKTVDKSIEQTENLIEKYKRIKTGLLQDLLSKGIDEKGNVRSKTTHRFVLKNGIEVPIEWEVSETMNELYMKGRIGWQGLKAGEFKKEGNYLVTGIHFTKDNKVNWNQCYRIDDFRYNEAPEIQLRTEDVLITKDGTIGKVAFIDSLPGKASLNSHLLVLRPIKENLLPRFIFFSFLDSRFKFFIESIKSGSTLVGLSQTNFGKYRLLIPPISEQRRIILALEEMNLLIEKEIAYLNKLHSLKTGLMQDLLNGKVRV